MLRRIPDRGMPHLAAIEPCIGFGADGPVFGPPLDGTGDDAGRRANFNGGGRGPQARTITVAAGDGFSAVRTGGVVLDDVDLPLLSRVTNVATGNSALVGAVDRFDQPPLAPFLVVTLAQLVA